MNTEIVKALEAITGELNNLNKWDSIIIPIIISSVISFILLSVQLNNEKNILKSSEKAKIKIQLIDDTIQLTSDLKSYLNKVEDSRLISLHKVISKTLEDTKLSSNNKKETIINLIDAKKMNFYEDFYNHIINKDVIENKFKSKIKFIDNNYVNEIEGLFDNIELYISYIGAQYDFIEEIKESINNLGELEYISVISKIDKNYTDDLDFIKNLLELKKDIDIKVNGIEEYLIQRKIKEIDLI